MFARKILCSSIVFYLVLFLLCMASARAQTPAAAPATTAPPAKAKPVTPPPKKPAANAASAPAAKTAAVAPVTRTTTVAPANATTGTVAATKTAAPTSNVVPGRTPPVAQPARGAVPARTSGPSANVAPANSTMAANGLPSRNAGSAATAAASPYTSAASSSIPNTRANSLVSQPATTTGTAPGATTAANNNSGRGAIATQGVGTFQWPGGWEATAYSCYRTGTRVLCDFDTSRQQPTQTPAQGHWGCVNLVSNGGKISTRRDAYFLAADGSRMPNAYVSTTPVRFIIEFDDVGQQTNSASLVCGQQQIQNVSIQAAAANAPTAQP